MDIGFRPVTLTEKQNGRVLEIDVTGKLRQEDYEVFVPEVERLIGEHGKIRMLMNLHDFHGWSASALWEDVKFGAKHFAHIEKLAFVGETKWQKGMAIFCKPFTTAEVRYFDHERLDEAREWVAAD